MNRQYRGNLNGLNSPTLNGFSPIWINNAQTMVCRLRLPPPPITGIFINPIMMSAGPYVYRAYIRDRRATASRVWFTAHAYMYVAHHPTDSPVNMQATIVTQATGNPNNQWYQIGQPGQWEAPSPADFQPRPAPTFGCD